MSKIAYDITESFCARPQAIVRAGIIGLAALLGACSDASAETSAEPPADAFEQALFDSGDIRVTAGSAMVVAYERTLADGIDRRR